MMKDHIFEGKLFQSEGALYINAFFPVTFITVGTGKILCRMPQLRNILQGYLTLTFEDKLQPISVSSYIKCRPFK